MAKPHRMKKINKVERGLNDQLRFMVFTAVIIFLTFKICEFVFGRTSAFIGCGGIGILFIWSHMSNRRVIDILLMKKK